MPTVGLQSCGLAARAKARVRAALLDEDAATM
jgi:hypothetical protein